MRVIALIIAWALVALVLVSREAAPGAWTLPAAARVALAVAGIGAAVWLWRSRRPGARWSAAAALALVLCALVPWWPARPSPDHWRQREEARLRARFDAARAAVGAREAHVQALATEARTLLADSALAQRGRERTFDALAALVVRHAAHDPEAAAGNDAGVGVQLFDARGALVAWTGASHPLDPGGRLTRLAAGTRPVHFRRRGAYTLLSYELRDPAVADTTAPRLAAATPAVPVPGPVRVLVDLPVDVHYRIRNPYLQSASLARGLSGDGVEIDLEYDVASIPPYLTRVDLELHGDEGRGLQAQGVIRDASGAALLLCHLSGLPYADAAEQAESHRDLVVRVLFVVAVAMAMMGLARRVGDRRASGVAVLATCVTGIVAVRALLAFLGLPPMRLQGSLLNPATFAMVGFGGVMRSPLDLALTAFGVAAVAAAVLLHRTGVLRRSGGGAATGAVRTWGGVVAAAGCIAVAVWSAARLASRVATDSNPHLIGPQLDLLSPAVVCLHAALWLGVAGWLMLAVLAADVLRGAAKSRAAVLAGAVAVAAVLWQPAGPIAAAVGVALFIAAARLRPLLRDERFTSLALAAFVLAALTATLNGDAIHRESERTARFRTEETVRSVLEPSDDLLRLGIEDILQKAREDSRLRGVLAADRSAQRGALAFELWAQSLLSQLGWSCRVSVYDANGQRASDFAVALPERERAWRELLEQARDAGGAVTRVEPEPGGPAGEVRSYVGAVALRAIDAAIDTSAAPTAGRVLGTVVVEVPFAPTSLDLAANPRTRAPELLRNLQQEGIGPRVDESERLLLAWLENGSVVESSTPYLEVSRSLSAAPAVGAGWGRLRLVNGDYLVTRARSDGRELLAGFRLATPLQRLLEWTQVASFGFAATALVLLVLLLATRLSAVRRRLPPLFVPKRFGFQQKLMAAFLVVALLPSVVLSLATGDVMRDRSQSRNRDAAVAKARAADAALGDLVQRDLDAVVESEFVRAILEHADVPPARELPEFGQIMIFRGDGTIVLDETLSNLSDDAARAFVRRAPRRMFASSDGGHLYLGTMLRVWFSPTEGMSASAPDAQPYDVYYRRRLTDELVRPLAPILGTDIGVFLGPRLVVSSQRGLAVAGLLPSLVPPLAFTHLELQRNPSVVLEEHAGGQRYFAGYLPLEDDAGRRIGVLSASQLLQADEFAVEVERTRELVLGLSTLMFVLTLVLGVGMATRIFDPVRSLIEGTRRVAGGDLGFRLRARAGDEIGELERSFNDMSASLLDTRRALDERRRYLEAVLGHIASGVVATDGEGRVTAANPAAYRILGLAPASLEGRSWRDLAAGGEPALSLFWRRLAEAPDGEVIEVPVHATPAAARADVAIDRLTLRVIVTDLVPAADGGAEHLGRVAIFEDVSELIRSKKLSAWAEMARQVAHEIKNPLTPMKLSAQFMEQAFRDRSEQFPRIFREGMATIVEQVESLRRIATEFSNFGRVQKLEPRPLELRALLRSVTAAYRSIEGLELDVDGLEDGAPGGLDGLQVIGDDEGLRRVFRNVLENAREAMGGRGRITVRVERPSADRVRVRISDSGPGVSTDAAARLFEPYFSTKNTGTGLGLAISKSILEELGGSITLANRTGGGAEAIVTLVVC